MSDNASTERESVSNVEIDVGLTGPTPLGPTTMSTRLRSV